MTYFEQALSAPELHFKRLRLVEPILRNGQYAIRRTYSAMEAEVRVGQQNYLLFLPFDKASLHHIEHLMEVMRERTLGPLIPNEILYDELTLVDSLGRKHNFDLILQAIPRGRVLEEAVLHYRADDLQTAIEQMKGRLDAIGFNHKKLTPANIVICENGRARPLRYWYAEWEVFSDNNISPLLDYISKHRHPELEHTKCPLAIKSEDEEELSTPTSREGITRICKCSRYGFVDSDGRQVTPFVYAWASDFCEGRAIVSNNNKYGAIDNCGRKVIPVIYNSLEFDINTGLFTATLKQYSYLINYEGEIIHRTKLENREAIEANIEI
jgi:hypothetical protein